MKKWITAFAIAVLAFMVYTWPAVVGTIVALTLTVWLAMTTWSKYRWKAVGVPGSVIVLLIAGTVIVLVHEQHVISKYGSADYTFGYWAIPPKPSAIDMPAGFTPDTPPKFDASPVPPITASTWQRFLVAQNGLTMDQCTTADLKGRPSFNVNCPPGTPDYFDFKAAKAMGLPPCVDSDQPVNSYETSSSGDVICYTYSPTKSGRHARDQAATPVAPPADLQDYTPPPIPATPPQ